MAEVLGTAVAEGLRVVRDEERASIEARNEVLA
jgi:hypothetical protein